MPYVVKTFDRQGKVSWLLRQNGMGYRRMGPRSMAERFPTELAAVTAASAMSAFNQMQMFFRVETIQS